MARPGTGERSQLAFNGGELSPLLHGRVDLDIWGRGCKQLENALPRKYGNAERRQGTRFVGEVKDSSGIVRLLPFRYSVSDTMCIEAGAGYFRFFKDGAPVLDDGGVYEVENPYTEAELFSLQYLELNDVLFLVHPDHPPYRLMRYSDVSWVMEECPFDEPAFQDQNLTTTTIAPSATTGTGISLTASSALFTASMVGGYFKLGQRRASTNVTLTENTEGSYTSSSLSIKGKVSIRSSGTWSGTLLLQRQDGATWNTVYTFVSSLDQNFNQSLEQSDKEYHDWRLSWDITNIDGDPVKAVLETEEGFVYGWAKVTGFTSDLVVTATVESDFQDTSPTDLWMEGSWSPYRGYPAAVSYYQDRVVYGGTYHQPQTVWGSCTGDYYNFEGITGVVSIKDTDAFAQTMGSTERVFIRWMEQLGNVLIVGTSAGEFSLSGTNGGDDPISATSVLIRLQTPTGDSGVKPVRVGTSLLHVQRDGKKLYELSYSIQSYSFADADVTQFAEHITGTGSGIVDMAFQRQPDPVLWCVRDDGVLLACVYDQAQKVVAWSRMTTQGTVESVCSIYGANGDEIWLLVKRTLGSGAEVKYIERLLPVPFVEKTDAWFVDCAASTASYDYMTLTEAAKNYVETQVLAEQDVASMMDAGGVVYICPIGDGVNRRVLSLLADGNVSTLFSVGKSDASYIPSGYFLTDFKFVKGAAADPFTVFKGGQLWNVQMDGTASLLGPDFFMIDSAVLRSGSIIVSGRSSYSAGNSFIATVNPLTGASSYLLTGLTPELFDAALHSDGKIYYSDVNAGKVYSLSDDNVLTEVLSSIDTPNAITSGPDGVVIASVPSFESPSHLFLLAGSEATEFFEVPNRTNSLIYSTTFGAFLSGVDYGAPLVSVGISSKWFLKTESDHGLSDGDVVKLSGTGYSALDDRSFAVDASSTTEFYLLNISYAGDMSGSYPDAAYVVNTYGDTVTAGTVRKQVAVVSNLSHLEGLTVSGVGDGSVLPDMVVTDGQVDLGGYYSSVILGLPYSTYVEPMGVEAIDSGASIGQTKRVRKMLVRLKDTLGMRYTTEYAVYHTIVVAGTEGAANSVSYRDVVFRDSSDAISESPDLFTGLLEVPLDAPHGRCPRVILRQDAPMPFNLLGVTYLFETTEPYNVQNSVPQGGQK